MLSDTALMVTGGAFAVIVGGVWALHRRALANQEAQQAPARRPPPPVAPMRTNDPAFDLSPHVRAPSGHGPARGGEARANVRGAGALDGARDAAPDGARRAGRDDAVTLAQARIEAQVIRAAVEDALGRLVDVYGPEYVDAFYARRVRRNVAPYRQLAASAANPATARATLRQANAAEAALQGVASAVLRQ